MNTSKEYNQEILDLIKNNPKGFSNLLLKNKGYEYLRNYINSNTLLLSDPKYKLATKLYWILNEIESFDDPRIRCKECGYLIAENVRNPLFGYGLFCSLQCCNKNTWHHENCKRTSEKHFGKDNYMNRRKAEETCLERFNSKHFMGTNLFFEKSQETVLSRYNVTNVMFYQPFVDKIKETKLFRYGDENYVNVEKTIQTNLEKYGVKYYAQTEEYLKRIKKFNIEHYGVEWYFQTEVQKEKSRLTCLQRYGAEHFAKSKYFRGERKLLLMMELLLDHRGNYLIIFG